MKKSAVLGYKALTGHTGPIKELLRRVRADGVKLTRVRPTSLEAQLPHTAHLAPGVSEYSRSSYDPTKKLFNNSKLLVGKGKPRVNFTMQPTPDGRTSFSYTPGISGGNNPSPIASMAHEAGHHLHHTAMRHAGIGDAYGGHVVPGMPHMNSVMNELGANNAALQFLQQAGAKPEVLAYYKGARRPSFRSYVGGIVPSGNPIEQRILDVGQHGFTPGYTGLPDLYKTASALTVLCGSIGCG